MISYVSVDIIFGQAIAAWWGKLENETEYNSYVKKRNRAAEFSRRYAAYDDDRTERAALDPLSKTIRVRGTNDGRQSSFNSNKF